MIWMNVDRDQVLVPMDAAKIQWAVFAALVLPVLAPTHKALSVQTLMNVTVDNNFVTMDDVKILLAATDVSALRVLALMHKATRV